MMEVCKTCPSAEALHRLTGVVDTMRDTVRANTDRLLEEYPAVRQRILDVSDAFPEAAAILERENNEVSARRVRVSRVGGEALRILDQALAEAAAMSCREPEPACPRLACLYRRSSALSELSSELA